jgi:hypothetical protein
VPRPAGGNATTSPTQRKTAKEGGATARKSATQTADTTAGAPSSAGGMSAAEKARLAAVDQRANQNKSAQTTHQSAAEASDEAHAAAKEPQKEADGRALGDQAEVLEQNPPPDPDLVRRIANIKADIEAKRPLKEEDLPKADPKEMAAAAGKEVSGDVKSAAAGVQTGYAPVDQKPTGTPSKDAVPIAPDAPPPAAPLPDAAAAAPDPVQASQASIDADKQAAAAKAKDAKLDRPEAALVKDGPVAEARAAQDDVNHAAIWGPDAVVKSSKEIQASAATDFKKAEADALKQMKAARAKQLAGVQGSKGDAKTGEEGKREALGKRLAAIYDDAQMRVHAKLQPLVPTALKMWDDGIAPLSDNFDHALGRVDEYIKSHKEHWYNRLGDALLGLPQWIVDEYELAESKFVEGAGALALTISSWVNGVIRDCQKLIADGRKAIQKELAGLDPELQAYALEEQKKIDKQFDGLAQEVVTAKSDFTKQLTQRLVSAIKEKDEQIQKLREMSKGLLQQFEDLVNEFIDDPLRAIINGLLRIVGIPPDQFWALVDKFAKVVDQIIDKPMVFANNLLAAIKLGFQQFKDNILSHLIAGLLNWLTSKLKDAGVEAPKDLSLKSMLTLFLQILGITWPKIRVKIVKYIGEKNMRRIELAWEFLKAFINDGWDGVWKLIKEKLDPQQLVDIVLNAVKCFIVESIVKKAAEYIVSLLNPAGAIYQALKLIYEAVTWIMDNASKIFTLIQSIVDGAANIMSGAIGGAATMIENALGAIVPIVIDLFAKLVGLGGVPDKVKEVVGGLQEMVSNAIDKVIEWVATKIGLTKDEDKKGGSVGERLDFEAGGEAHSLWIDVEGSDAVVKVASTPAPLESVLSDFERRAQKLQPQEQSTARGLIAKARTQLAATNKDADAVAKTMAPGAAPSPAPDASTIAHEEEALRDTLRALFAVFGEKAIPSVLWAPQLGAMEPAAAEYARKQMDAKGDSDAVAAMKEWSDVRKWLEARPGFQRPLGGPLKNTFWKLVADSSGIVKLGFEQGFTDRRYFGTKEKARLAGDVDGGSLGVMKTALLGAVFAGGGADIKDDVVQFVFTIDSKEVTYESDADGRAPAYQGYGAWRGGELDYAFPKHVSWKDRIADGYWWQLQAHHIWPQYLRGQGVATVPMRAGLHQRYHDIERGMLGSYRFVASRTVSAGNAAFNANPVGFVGSASAFLIDTYEQFQTDHVVVGKFESYAVSIVKRVTPSDL